jgi:flavin-dependent dehydrogenase
MKAAGEARKHDALVIGGGLAGATVAARLAGAGRSVALFEKSMAPHDMMCGEFLSQEALHYLERSGIDPIALGGVPLHGVRIARRGIVAEARLPFRAVSLRRRVLDEAVLQHARDAGAEVRRGVRVQAIRRDGPGHVARLEGETSVSGASVFLATGKHDLQGQPRVGGWQNNLVAFKMYFRLTDSQREELSEHVELILFPGGYAGLQPVDAGLANLCLLVTRGQLRRSGANWAGLLEHLCAQSPHLAERLRGATPVLDRPLALSSIPYGFLADGTAAVPGVWRVGDQAAVIPSFSGDGMSIALHSAHLAAELYLNGASSSEFAARMRRELRGGITLATGISQLLVRLPGAAGLSRWRPGLLREIAMATRIPRGSLLGS